ncbi:MAG: Coenzyme F420 hydrogenase/dehydrogenase, beta subunit C-terminal domain [Chloroflexi bacterium]|nr:Coenzyme F420 hydrogenase/dehydrogenase, beta subunit C-terminal domain [Chloroflexota bacterium]
MAKCAEVVQDILRGMLRERLVDEVVAFGRGLTGSDILPLFITDEQDIDRIVTTSYCPSSLAKLVARYGDRNKKMAIVVRSCDARGLVEIAKRRQVKPENLYLVGIECYGVVREKRGEVYIFADKMEVDGEMMPLDEAALSPNCRRCEYPVPTMADISCRIEPEGDCLVTVNTEKGKAMLATASVPVQDAPPSDVAAIKERAARWQEKDFGDIKRMEPGERLDYWLSQFDRCIKCYGCRDACPICVCKECCLEPDRGLIKGGEYPPETLFHAVRLTHVGESCVNCGQCEAACPMEIPVSKLYHMLSKEVGSIFNYEPGLDIDSLPPVSMVDEEDLLKTGVDFG